MANVHTTLTSLFDDIADAIRENTPVTEQIKADAFPAYIKLLGYTGTVPATPSVLNSCPWDFISWASDQGIADLLWSVGDRKAVELGAWGVNSDQQVAPGTYYCYIIGFDHNASLEGEHRIHFELGFTDLSGGSHIAFASSTYSAYWASNTTTVYFQRMNPTDTNAGGWEACTMRTGTLNGDTRSFKRACPSDLLSAVKTVTKYTDNVGGGSGNVQANVTATTDTFFLLNVNELRGSGTMNTYEQEKTEQYQYYKNGNPQGRVRSDTLSGSCVAILRSPTPSNNYQFMGVNENEVGVYTRARYSYAYSPAFCV